MAKSKVKRQDMSILVGKQFAELRRSSRITQDKLALDLNMTKMAISQFENNGIGKFDTAVKLFNAIGYDITFDCKRIK